MNLKNKILDEFYFCRTIENPFSAYYYLQFGSGTGLTAFLAHWAYINNILVILVGPNRLGRVVGHDNVWA